MSDFIYQNNTLVSFLDCKKAFEALTEKEKLYAHYLSRAAWYGGLIVLVQTSLESPLIYTLLQNLFRSQPIDELKRIALNDCDFTEDDFTALLVFTSGLLSNMGNYKGFGDTKFIPNLPQEKLKKLLSSSKAMQLEPKKMEKLLQNCFDKMYSLDNAETQLGFPHIGKTSYLSKNFTEEDKNVVSAFFKEKNFQPYNTRLIKTVDEGGQVSYEIRLASVLSTEDKKDNALISSHSINGHKFFITRGDYGKLLKYVNENLQLAMEHAANDTEVKMLENYIKSFETGVLEFHIDGSRHWIKDKGPVVESYIGFIETYKDPAGVRGEFESFVAIVNKPMSVKFENLVNAAEILLPLLPWPKEYEKDTFLKPDFTSLDILTFACSGLPAGICIPNYEEVRQNEGFKNVSLGNVIQTAYKNTNLNYLSDSDKKLLFEHSSDAFEVVVGLHELLGHGSGKMFQKTADGNFNFDRDQVLDLERNEKISWYNEGETFDSIFSTIGSGYEECRAECVALYLATDPTALKIFGYERDVAENMMYVCWLDMVYKGLEGLQMYSTKTQSWLQAHCHARYVILKVLLEAGNDLVKIERIDGTDGKPDLLLSLDRSKILSVGKPAIGAFLKRLQLYRATADAKRGKAMFEEYSKVTSEGPNPFLDYREIVMARKRPRKLLCLGNTCIEDGKVVLKEYDSSHEGMIQSFVERFPEKELDDVLQELWAKDKPHF